MTVAIGAGPGVDSVHTLSRTAPASHGSHGAGWANVRPLDLGTKGAVDGWIDLLARISHDLRTPLNAVIGFSDLMQRELFGPLGDVRYQEYARHIRTSGEELLTATEDALAMTTLLAQPRAVCVGDVPLAALVDKIVADLACSARTQGISFVIEIDAHIQVRSDARMLTRAIRQMLVVAVGRAARDTRINITARPERGAVEIAVDVVEALNDGPQLTVKGSAAHLELGLGRLDLPVWLAVALLDALDCTLTLDLKGGSLLLSTAIEHVVQPDFFAHT